MERNADVVNLSSYAPLFAHVDGWQWTPDLIWVNNLESYGTPNYYVQKLFSTNKGTDVVPALLNGKSISGQDSLYVSAVIDKVSNEIIIKLVNASGTAQRHMVNIEGPKKIAARGSIIILQNDDNNIVNSIEHPGNIVPQESVIDITGNKLNLTCLPYSLSVVKLKM